MNAMSGPRTQADRDAVTVEIMFAVVTGALLAALLFFVCASPALFGDLGRAAEKTWLKGAAITATVGFAARSSRSCGGCRTSGTADVLPR
ncbi:hypothetical protein SBI_09284 [Streptomyces bingchenggensis BCW-1]|uniref:Uncharacterized protein n=2 Tax=Streptomyces TaxID=1883 RepID=D7C5M3_STRBB|nr:hypothetical protein SBI_09284 [Streptomyces bingchenggensis BCW-1]